jgi:ribosomal protein S18 acetylase RimI-like enzyme
LIDEAFAALVAGDKQVATRWSPVPGGVRFDTPELPEVRDYNAVVLGPGARLQAPGGVTRVIAFEPVGDPPAGWDCEFLAAMAYVGEPPAAPAGVAPVESAALREARTAVWREHGVGDEELAQVLEMQDRQAAAGTLLAVTQDEQPVGWVQVVAAVIEDVYVLAAARGQGHGRALTLAAMAAGGRFLTVEPDNTPAVELYRSLGFVAIGTVVQCTRPG